MFGVDKIRAWLAAGKAEVVLCHPDSAEAVRSGSTSALAAVGYCAAATEAANDMTVIELPWLRPGTVFRTTRSAADAFIARYAGQRGAP